MGFNRFPMVMSVYRSDHILEGVFRDHDLAFMRAPEAGEACAYRVRMGGVWGRVVLREVLTSQAERAQDAALGSTPTGRVAGKRIRETIVSLGARGSGGSAPFLLVLACEHAQYLDRSAYFVRLGLYGYRRILRRTPEGRPATEAVDDGRLSSPSAVAVLEGVSPARLAIYHNANANHALPMDWLRSPRIRHYVLTGADSHPGPGWKEALEVDRLS